MSVLQKNKKVAAGVGVAAAAAAVLALGAGTYAAFTDTEDAQTTFAAGTLDLTLGEQVAAPAETLENLAPGDEVTITYTADNVGSVDGNLAFRFTLGGAENGCVEPETDVENPCTDESELPAALLVKVGEEFQPVSNFVEQDLELGAMPAAADAQTYAFTFKVDENAGNEIMTDSAVIDAVATLTQS